MTGPVEPVADTEAVEAAVSVQFSFTDADVAAECECGWRTIGDASVDAFSAWWKHRATHDYQSRPVASSSTREDGEGLTLPPNPFGTSATWADYKWRGIAEDLRRRLDGQSAASVAIDLIADAVERSL